MAVYFDLIVLLNFLVDFLLLLGTNCLSGFPAAPLRSGLAALLGGIYGGLSVVPAFRFLNNTLWRVIFLLLISVIAFGCDRSAVKRGGVFILLSMAMGGISVSFGSTDFIFLVLAAVSIRILCRIAFGARVGGQEYIPLSITYGNRTESMIALRDSGNHLHDPITGEQVFLIAADAAKRLTGLTEHQLQHPLETLTQRPIPGLKLIPYRAVGCGDGMLLALRFENIKLGNHTRSAIVAFAPEGLGRGDCYQALVTAE